MDRFQRPFPVPSVASHTINWRANISKTAASTISVGVSKIPYCKAECTCNASTIVVVLLSNLKNTLDFSVSVGMTITLPFYLISTQTFLQAFIKEKKSSQMECRTKFTFQTYESKSYGRSLIRKIQLAYQFFMPNQLIHQNIFIKGGNRFLDH